MRRRFVVFPLLAVTLTAADPKSGREFAWETLQQRLEGAFSSEAQAREDPDYFDVRFHVLPLWRSRSDYRWIYVERAVPGRPEAPYRQTVYRLGDDPFARKSGSRYELLAYSLSDPGRFAGAALDPAKLDAMTPADLVARPRCTVQLVQGDGGDFAGGTRGRDCPGETPGVAYVTSEWTVGRETLRVWDRAFDAEGRLVWGATRGPYLFRRLVPSSSP